MNNGQYIRFAEAYLPPRRKIHKLRAEYKKQVLLGDLLYPTVAETDSALWWCWPGKGKTPALSGS